MNIPTRGAIINKNTGVIVLIEIKPPIQALLVNLMSSLFES